MTISPNIVIKKCKQAGVSFWSSSKVAVELKEEIQKLDERQLIKRIASKLEEFDEEAAEQFNNYHSIKVRTSKNVIENFDRKRITDSLIKETKIPKAVAEQIAQEVELDIRRFQLKDISSPLVREMVNSTLLQKKLINAKINYSRIGLPVHDIKKIVENRREKDPSMMNYYFGNRVMEEYTLTKVMPKQIKEAHLNSDIYIHSLRDFITKPESIQNNLRFFLKNGFVLDEVVTTGPAKKAEVAVSHAARVLLTSKQFASKGVGFDFFNYYIAPYLKGKTKKQVQQTAQTFLYEINRSYYSDNAFTVNLEEQIPDLLKKEKAIGPGGKEKGVYGDYEKEAKDFMKILLDVMEKGDYANHKFKWPNINIKYKKTINEKIKLPRKCSLLKQDINKSLVYNSIIHNKKAASGTMQSISINLPKIAKLSKNEDEFYEELEEKIEVVKKVNLIKKELMQEKMETNVFSFLSENNYLKIEKMQNNLILTGLPQATMLLNNSNEFGKSEIKQAMGISRFCGKKLRAIGKKDDLIIKLGERHSTDALTRFTTANKIIGIEMDLSNGLVPNIMDEEEKIEVYKQMQPLFEAGAFYETNSKNLLKDKDFLFLKTF